MGNILILIPMIIYLVVMLGIAVYTSKISNNTKGGFIEEYFIGGRTMGGFVLAMTLIATYSSASSFVGGPGVAFSKGLGWVFLAMIQVPTAFLTLGVLGKKFALISRKINAVTVTDFLRARYKSDIVVILSSIAILAFFAATMVAQFIGGARLFQAVTGYSYVMGLVIFGIAVIIYTTVGGFRAVALTDAIQGVVMVLATVFLLFAVIKAGGGASNAIQTISQINPGALEPTAGGTISKPFILSFWILVGLGVLGLPQTTVRGMGFKDSKSMHDAMIIGTFIVGFLMLGMHLVGVFGQAVITEGVESSDLVIPTLTIQVLHPVLAGIFIAGPLAAIMSTVDSMLILASAAIIKDLFMHYSKSKVTEKKLSTLSFVTTAILGIIVFIFSINPPDLIVWINLFAFGGLEAAFLCPTVFGLYWKRANATGAIFSFIGGVGAYFYYTMSGVKYIGMHQIVPTIAIAIVLFVIGSYMGRKPDKETLVLFYGEE